MPHSWKISDLLNIKHFILIAELNEELDEEEKHVKTGEKLLSGSQTKQNDLKKRRDKKYLICT